MIVETERKRGWLLTAWLIILLIGLILGLIIYLFSGLILSQFYPGPFWVFLVLAIITIMDIVFIIAIFKWKKWGVYGFVGLSIITFIINLFIFGLRLDTSTFSLVGLIVLILLVRPKWNLFE